MTLQWLYFSSHIHLKLKNKCDLGVILPLKTFYEIFCKDPLWTSCFKRKFEGFFNRSDLWLSLLFYFIGKYNIHTLTGEAFLYFPHLSWYVRPLTEVYSFTWLISLHQTFSTLSFLYFLVSVDRFPDSEKFCISRLGSYWFFPHDIKLSSCSWDICCLYQVPCCHMNKSGLKFYIALDIFSVVFEEWWMSRQLLISGNPNEKIHM